MTNTNTIAITISADLLLNIIDTPSRNWWGVMQEGKETGLLYPSKLEANEAIEREFQGVDAFAYKDEHFH